jgi:cytochrome P450
MLGFWSRPTAYVERCRHRYGRRFTLRVIGTPPFVMLSDPDEIRQLFGAAPDVLHPGQGARVLEPLLGASSVLLLDEAPHLEQRRLLLPAFHGARMARLGGMMSELTDRELASWPRDEPVALHPRLQRLTLEIILRAAFGFEHGARISRLRDKMTEVLVFAESPISVLPPWVQRLPVGTPGRLQRVLAEVDAMIYEEIDERRRGSDGTAGEDILSMLLTARHEDGSPMSAQELRDELMTALVAGHETTASQLAWAFERLVREPAALGRLRGELRGDGDEYLTATIQEVMRRRPVVMNAEPRLTMQEVRIGDWTYPPGVALLANAWLVHHDAANYPDPYAFRPERFLGRPPGTYTWIPFGGGRRRCLGASFAMLEMKTVLRAVLERCDVRPVSTRAEPARRRSITISPAGGATVILHDRVRRSRAPGAAVRDGGGGGGGAGAVAVA